MHLLTTLVRSVAFYVDVRAMRMKPKKIVGILRKPVDSDDLLWGMPHGQLWQGSVVRAIILGSCGVSSLAFQEGQEEEARGGKGRL